LRIGLSRVVTHARMRGNAREAELATRGDDLRRGTTATATAILSHPTSTLSAAFSPEDESGALPSSLPWSVTSSYIVLASNFIVVSGGVCFILNYCKDNMYVKNYCKSNFIVVSGHMLLSN
ncbi:unnamed protein product, partial [Urochloa humidicola]